MEAVVPYGAQPSQAVDMSEQDWCVCVLGRGRPAALTLCELW